MDKLLAFQGWYYLTSGVWPIVHMRSFEAVTGPKTDKWLVKTVGALVAVTGISLLLAARQSRRDRALVVLAVGSAAALGFIDWLYAGRGRISKIYMVDGTLEFALMLLLLMTGDDRSSNRGGKR